MPSNRTARDKGRTSWAYHELYEGDRPSIPGLMPATFLPVVGIDKAHDDDPVVLLPGTVVGRTGTGAIGSLPTSTNQYRPLVPACPVAYDVTYSAYDDDAQDWGGTIDIDGTGGVVAAGDTAASTTQLGPILPIGIVPQPVYSPLLPTRFNNYDRNMAVSPVLVQNQAILIPAITTAEKLIEPGDAVVVDDSANPDYDPIGDPTGSTPGRLMRFAGTTTGDVATLKAKMEYRVGRCIDKFPIAQQSSTSAGQTYRAALGASNVNTASVSALWGFSSMRLVQTVPGLGLPGSGTEGVPGSLTFATADASGYFWGLVIVVQIA
jgi:hypothetical protein